MEELLAEQVRCVQLMSNTVANLKRKGAAKITVGLIEARIERLRTLWEEFRARDQNLMKYSGEAAAKESSYFSNDGFGLGEDTFLDQLGGMIDYKKSLEPAPKAPEPPVVHAQPEPPPPGATPSQPPRLSLPSFSGDYSTWRNFRDLFVSMIATRDDIPRVQKLQHLKTCLSGEPLQLLANIAITDANYDLAWQALENRYDNKRLLVNNHVSALCQIKPAKSESAAELRRIYHTTTEILGAVDALGVATAGWDVLLVHLTVQRLDPQSARDWETSHGHATEPSRFAELKTFLENRIRALEALEHSSKSRPSSQSSHGVKPAQPQMTSKFRYPVHRSPPNNVLLSTTGQPATPRSSSGPTRKCSVCNGPHYITSCAEFKRKSTRERRDVVARLELCYNCLGHHAVRECRSERRCITCGKNHNSLLHSEDSGPGDVPRKPAAHHPGEGTSSTVATSEATKQGTFVGHAAIPATPRRAVLLATARVLVTGPDGISCPARALLDQGSEISFVSESLAQTLKLPRKQIHIPLSGIAAVPAGVAKHSAAFRVSSGRSHGSAHAVTAIVLPRLTNVLPSSRFTPPDLTALQGLHLADPHYARAESIDLILGADVYGQILLSGLRRVPNSDIIAQCTVFGWVLSGPIRESAYHAPLSPLSSFHVSTNDNLVRVLQNFWEIEEIPDKGRYLTPDEEKCEQHYQATHQRDPTGRYVVRLPCKPDRPAVAAAARSMAINSLSSLEHRLRKDPETAAQYTQFLTDYQGLGHMDLVPPSHSIPLSAWYLPHHAVVQNGKKLRVVFDASRRIPPGVSLNDFLLPGPALQNDLTLVLSEWRTHRLAFSADIVKMFRQIEVHPDDRDLQRILWRLPDQDSISDFRLRTVTYGTACAPFLAIRTLRQLADDEGSRFPLGAHSLVHNSFVDDILCGADDTSSLLEIKTQLEQLLDSGGFALDKWATNHQLLLSEPGSSSSAAEQSHSFDPQSPVKMLGLMWLPSEDSFSFQSSSLKDITRASLNVHPTKRIVLSCTARMFDPLGWISPVVIAAKILMQDLWLAGIDWDDPLPPPLEERWREYSVSLQHLDQLRVPRWTGYTPSSSHIQLHGFADASSRAYAAVIYLRTSTRDGQHTTAIIMAKTKVAPVKPITIPRLELCSALLLTRLLQHLRKLPFYSSIPISTWLDSQVALNWLKGHPSSWTNFVANRVSTIQTSLPGLAWNYVPTNENPADLATRGISPQALISNPLWQQGPAWLKQEREVWPRPHQPTTAEDQERKAIVAVAVVEPPASLLLLLIERFSSLQKVLRVTAYVLRFVSRLRRRKTDQSPEFSTDFLSRDELKHAKLCLVRCTQLQSFPDELKALETSRPLPRNSPIASLSPFLDENNLLRVGGRLQHSTLPYEERHPPILPKDHQLSRLFIAHAHERSIHGGQNLTLAFLMKEAWILRAKCRVKGHLRSCVVCHRYRARCGSQKMGTLPERRVTPQRPFATSGLDYAGPISLTPSRGRARTTLKGYICLFVCTATKALHLEVVSDCTSAAFIAAFRRFCGRRGIPTELWSDNSTTFHGASAELRVLFDSASEFYSEVAPVLANDGTRWSFIPPRAPHFGGLWEAGVKSVKSHLTRLLKDRRLTYEELSTLLIQIEACLNSRPLCPQSDHIDDLNALTPGHFLIGSSFASVPEPTLLVEPENHLSRWQLVQRMHQDFWRRWSQEYLYHLQQRTKWREPQVNFKEGQLVLVQDDRYPPAKWPLARITQVHPGPDGLVRSVTVRTATSSFDRPIVKLSPLPLPSNI